MKKILLTALVLAGISATAQVKVGSNPTTIDTGTTNFQVEGTTTAEQFVILKNGNVGIGTTTAETSLDVKGHEIYLTRNTGGSSTGPRLVFKKNKSSDPTVAGVPTVNTILGSVSFRGNMGSGVTNADYATGGAISVAAEADFSTTNSSAYMYFTTTSTGTITPSERMRITANGNVGIGTTTPTEKLEVTGSIKMVDGNQAAGKLMVSDANGKATWTAAATASNAKWVDGATAGDIELVNPTGAEDVRYTNTGFKSINKVVKTANIVENYDAATNTFVNPTEGLGFDNNHNYSLTKTASMVKTNPTNTWSSANSFVTRIDADDTRANETTLGLVSTVQVFSNNANNHNNVRGLVGYANTGGTGTINSLVGTFGGININKDQGTVNNSMSFQGYSVTNTSKAVNNFWGIQTSNVIGRYQTGTVGNFTGSQVGLSTSASGTTNITTVKGYDVAVGLNPTWTGTITNYYDFFAPNFTNGGGTVTNKYGIYIDGSDKTNFMAGKLNISGGSTASPAKLNIYASGDGAKVLHLGIERAWEFAQGSTGASTDLLLKSTASNKNFKIQSLAANVNNAVFYVADVIADNRVYLAPDGGRVGIGTSNPLTTFHVNGVSTTAQINNTGDINNIGSINQRGTINLLTAGANPGGYIQTTGESDFTNGIEIVATRGQGKLVFSTNNGTIGERMRITANGNVGIGTTTPTSKLSVVGLPVLPLQAVAGVPTAGYSLGDFYHTGDGIVRVMF